MDYSFYVLDCESTGLDTHLNDPIEISIFRLNSNEDAHRTWHLKPFNKDTIEAGALKVNGHKLEDLLHQTKEGREKYLDPHKVIVDIENWISTDGMPAEKRFMIGQNVAFDKELLEQLWIKCGAKDAFPFGRRYMDTMIIELFTDYCKGQFAEGYNLKNILKKYNIKNERAHSASADVAATKQLFEKQVEIFKKLMK